MLHPQDSYPDSVMKHDLHANMHIAQLHSFFSASNWLWKAKAVQCRILHGINTGQVSFVHALPSHTWPVKQAQTQTRITLKRDISRIGVEQNPNLAVLCIVCLISTDELHDNQSWFLYTQPTKSMQLQLIEFMTYDPMRP